MTGKPLDAYGVDGTPSAVLVRPGGAVRQPGARQGVQGVAELVGELGGELAGEPTRLRP